MTHRRRRLLRRQQHVHGCRHIAPTPLLPRRRGRLLLLLLLLLCRGGRCGSRDLLPAACHRCFGAAGALRRSLPVCLTICLPVCVSRAAGDRCKAGKGSGPAKSEERERQIELAISIDRSIQGRAGRSSGSRQRALAQATGGQRRSCERLSLVGGLPLASLASL